MHCAYRRLQYTYLLSVPCIIAYSVGFAAIKYQEGFTVLPEYGSESTSRLICLCVG